MNESSPLHDRSVKLLGFFFLLLIFTSIRAQNVPESQPPLWHDKPGVAAFELAENIRLAAAQLAIDQLVALKGPRTIDNTLTPYDEAVRLLNAAYYFSNLMQKVHPEPTFRDHAAAITRTVNAAWKALSLNRGVYRALAALDLTQRDAATRYYVQHQLREFRPGWCRQR